MAKTLRQRLKFLRNFWIVNFFARMSHATAYYNYKYWQIFKWLFASREDGNHTYELTEANIQYLANIVAVVTNTSYDTALGHINEAMNDKVLRSEILEAVKKSPFRKFADLEVNFGRRLGWYAFVRCMKPKVVVETGVDKGLGSILLCAALLRNKAEGHDGRYYGTEINPDAGYILNMNPKYKEIGEILYGDSIQTLLKFDKTIDVFINDSDHSAGYEYDEYVTIKNMINDKSVILGDNSHATDKLCIFSIETKRDFLFFKEVPKDHWFPGAGIGISFMRRN